MLVVSLDELVTLLSTWLWPFARIGAFVVVAPIFSASYVPARFRVGIAVALSLVIIPVVPPLPAVAAMSAEGIMILTQQIMIGLVMGFVLRLVWSIFELAGQAISQPMALHFAAMVDPTSGVQVPMVSQFYVIVGTLVFLVLNGHLVFIDAMVQSFTVLPIGITGIGSNGLWHLVEQMQWVFASAVLIALPAVTALLTMNFGFGVMARAAPQLNIFAVGFPLAIALGFGIMLLTLPIVTGQFENLFNEATQFLTALLAGTL